MATIFGNASNQTLTGTSTADTIYGGNSTSETNTGNDTINAGAGNDTVVGGDGSDSAFGGSGADTLYGGVGTDRLDAGTGGDTLYGGAGTDSLDGAAGNDVIDAGDGADTVEGGGGSDTITGGLGNDILYGDDPTPPTATTETLRWSNQGASGTDLSGGFTQDTGSTRVTVTYTDTGAGTGFTTNGSTQYVASGETFSTTSAGSLNGTGTGPTSTTRISFATEDGTGFTDEVTDVRFRLNDVDTGAWQDVLTINAYDANGNLVPVTITPAGNDTVSGNTITAGSTNDAASSAQGSVLVTIPGPVAYFEIVYSNAAAGSQVVYVTDVQFTTGVPSDGADSIAGGDGVDTIFGGGGDDILSGDAGADSIAGGAGNDTISGGADADSLLGDAGSDTITGGLGTDAMFGGDGADVFAVAEGDGADTVQGGEGGTDQDTIRLTGTTAGVTLTFSASETGTWSFAGTGGGSGSFSQIEAIEATAFNDTITATAATTALTLSGLDGADSILGGSGADALYGGTGNDTLNGAGGNDSLYGGDGADRSTVGASEGTDLLQGGEGGTDQDLVAFAAGTTGAGVSVTLTGSEAGSYTFGSGSGTFSELEQFVLSGNADTFNGAAATAGLSVAAGAGADSVTGGSGADTLSGEDGNDSLSGGQGADTLYGGIGNDTLAGGAGGDSLYGGDGSDTIQVGASEGADLIEGGEGGTDQDAIRFDAGATTSGVTVTLSGSEAGTYAFGTGTGSFTEMERFDLTANADLFDGRAATQGLSVAAGAGDDIVGGGAGGDTLDGGDGNDMLGGFDGADTVSGGAGNDLIAGGTGADTIFGGSGADTIYLEDAPGADVIDGGSTGTDLDSLDFQYATTGVTVTFTGSEAGGFGGATFTDIERVALTDQADVADAGANTSAVTLEGRGGADSLIGGSGADVIDGGTGADTLAGGAGADTLDGGIGDDAIQVAQGDSASGGDGADTFTLADLGEAGTGAVTVVGGTGFDRLMLGDLADLSTLQQFQAVDGSWYGTVTLDDGSVLTFSEMEQVICFASGTRIATPEGARPVEDLREGDLVVTRDHGLQAIRWAGSRRVPASGALAPVRIRPGVVPGLERDLVVSPQHKILFQGYRAELLFGESEVLVPAVHLVDGVSVTREEGGWVTYHHILFDRHEIVYAEGAATESFHPGEEGLKGVDDEAREELFALFPELRTRPGRYGPAARRCLKKHEARLLRA